MSVRVKQILHNEGKARQSEMCLRKDDGEISTKVGGREWGYEVSVCAFCLRSSKTVLFFDVYKLVFSQSSFYQKARKWWAWNMLNSTASKWYENQNTERIIANSNRSNSSILSFACCDWMIMRTGTIPSK